MNERSIESLNYHVGWVAAFFAPHSAYKSFSTTNKGIIFYSEGGKELKRISYLAMEPGIAIEAGYFWDILAVHLDDGKIQRFGGISKNKTSQLQVFSNTK